LTRAWALALLLGSLAGAQTPSLPSARVEARSPDLLAVGTVQGDRMAVHLSRILDNAPVGNAGLAVMLRGTTHPAVAEADGSYSIQTPDLQLPGPASIEFLVTVGDKRGAQGDPGGRRCGPTRRQEQLAPARLVGAQLRRMHRLSVALEPAQVIRRLEALHRLHEHLEPGVAGHVLEREREVDVQHVAEA